MKKILILILILFFVNTGDNTAQWQLNFGLAEKQDPETLPQSRVPLIQSIPKRKNEQKPELISLTPFEYLLSSGWKMADEHMLISSGESVFDHLLDTKRWYNATVPGTVLTTLVNEGIYPDPYWGINNMLIPDTLCRTNWWYRLVFDAPKDTGSKRLNLLFNGINYKAEVWLNGFCLGYIKGAFSRGQFDITDVIKKDSKNILAVKIIPPPNPGIAQEASFMAGHGPNGGIMCLDGPTFISSEGWDWIPAIRDRNIGIWQDVRLQLSGNTQIVDPQIITDLNLPDTTVANITVKARVKNTSNQVKTVKLKIKCDNISLSHNVSLLGNEDKLVVLSPNEYPQLKIKNPRLWWPNGYGQQNLYSMKIEIEESQNISDAKNVRFGIRELEYELSAYSESFDNLRFNFNPIDAYKRNEPIFDNVARREIEGGLYLPKLLNEEILDGITMVEDAKMDSYLVVKVNGQRIFCKGGNWGMDDGMKRVSRERLEPYFMLHKEQNFNMIRNWTGESTEEVFYELCDEYGMLVFNDFWLSSEGYNLNVADNQLFLDNVREAVVRFRNHPSLAIWCPRNEGFAPSSLESKINRIIAQEDGTRHYMPSSIKMNITKSGPWDYKQSLEYYSFAAGFNTEAGSPSVPTAETILKMMSPEDAWPIGDVWSYHDWHMGDWGGAPFMANYKNAIDNMFGESDNLFDFCKKAQLVNYESYRAIFEAWNSKMWDNASGVLLWMSHPAWFSVVWQTYSYDYETPGAYFGAKKACTPVHVQMDLDSHKVKIINTSLTSYTNLNVVAKLYSLNGKLLSEQTGDFGIPANQMKEIFTVNIRSNEDVVFVKLYLKNSKDEIIDDNFYWHFTGEGARDFTAINNLPDANLKVDIKDVSGSKNDGFKGVIEVTNTGSVPALSIKLNLINDATNDSVLPTFFSDGYFSLMPSETKTISFFCPYILTKSALSIQLEGYNLKTMSLKI